MASPLTIAHCRSVGMSMLHPTTTAKVITKVDGCYCCLIDNVLLLQILLMWADEDLITFVSHCVFALFNFHYISLFKV